MSFPQFWVKLKKTAHKRDILYLDISLNLHKKSMKI